MGWVVRWAQHVRDIVQKSDVTSVELTNKYNIVEEFKEELKKFLIYYNINRKHGGLTKELKVRTPCEVVKSWFEIEPEIFKISPDEFYTIALRGVVQCGEIGR